MTHAVPLLSVTVLVSMLLLAPAASAEFGEEDEHGWQINVDGEVVKPPVEQTALLTSMNPYDPLNKAGPVTAYPYYPILTAELIRLSEEYPDLVKLSSAGKSTAQLDLWMLEIADFGNPDMKPLEDREVVYLDGGTHSNEYSGVYFVTEVAQFLIEEYETNETAKWIVENRHTWILPMVNPDGSNAFGRMNANWVNVNRNFPGSWGEVNEDMLMNNPGPEPASEPESQAVIKVLDELDPDYVNSIHCCGNLWLHPWGAEHLAEEMDFEEQDAEMFRRTCDEAFAAVRDRCGEIWSTIYPASGTTADEGYHRNGAASWTYEMSGRGAISLWGQPVIIDDVREQEVESWEGVMHAFLNVHKYGAHPEVVAVAGTADALEITIENIGYGRLVAGNVTIDGETVSLPEIGPSPRDASMPGNMTTVTVPGQFEPGETEIEIDWTKRVRHAQQGDKSLLVTLSENGDRLIGEIGGSGAGATLGDPAGQLEDVPAIPLVGVALAVMFAIGLVSHRRRK